MIQVEIKKRSRVPGVMITQYVKELPRGKTTPDFTRKPISLTVQEGINNIYMPYLNYLPCSVVKFMVQLIYSLLDYILWIRLNIYVLVEQSFSYNEKVVALGSRCFISIKLRNDE